MAADRHRAFCVGAPRSLSVLRGKSDPLDTYRVCRTLRYYYKALLARGSSLSTGPHARNPGPRAQPPWAPRHCAFSNWDFSARPAGPKHSHRQRQCDTVLHRDHSFPCSAGLSVHLLLFARESDLFGASLHARRPRPRPSAQGPPHARELGCMCMRTHTRGHVARHGAPPLREDICRSRRQVRRQRGREHTPARQGRPPRRPRRRSLPY